MAVFIFVHNHIISIVMGVVVMTLVFWMSYLFEGLVEQLLECRIMNYVIFLLDVLLVMSSFLAVTIIFQKFDTYFHFNSLSTNRTV